MEKCEDVKKYKTLRQCEDRGIYNIVGKYNAVGKY